MTKIIADNCDGCGECIDACSNSAITIEDNKAVINKELCLGCGVCIVSCPQNAIIPDNPRTKYQVHRPIPKRSTFFYQINYPILNQYHHRIRRKRGRRRFRFG